MIELMAQVEAFAQLTMLGVVSYVAYRLGEVGKSLETLTRDVHTMTGLVSTHQTRIAVLETKTEQIT